MLFLSDDQVRSLITADEAISTLRDAFIVLGHGEAALQPRIRSGIDNLSLSTMGAIIPGTGVCGAKVYTTLSGQFDFVIALFSVADGHFLGVVQGNALTEFRTAALTRVVSDLLAPEDARVLTVFGTGVQARAHLRMLATRPSIETVFVVGLEGVSLMVDDAQREFPDLTIAGSDAESAVSKADIVVTATRSTTPLFDGAALGERAFVAAIGSSKPTSRELDDTTLARAELVAVESLVQAKVEAGDLLLAAPGALDWSKVHEVGELLAGRRTVPTASGVTVFKSVGIGLADVALAAHAFHKANLAS